MAFYQIITNFVAQNAFTALSSAAVFAWIINSLASVAAIRNIKRGSKVSVIAHWVCGISGLLDKEGKAPAPPAPPATLLPLLLVASLGAPWITGCAGTFEEARAKSASSAPRVRLYQGTSGVSADTSQSERCAELSDREYWFGGASTALGATGAGAVIAVIPTSDKWETELLIAGASTVAGATVAGWLSHEAASQYVEEGCGR